MHPTWLWQLLWLNRPLVKPAGQSWMRSIWSEFASATLGDKEIPSFWQVVKTAVEGLSENSNFVPSLACKQTGCTHDAWLAPCMIVKRWTCVLSLVHLRVDKIKGDAKARNHTEKREFQLIKLAWIEAVLGTSWWHEHSFSMLSWQNATHSPTISICVRQVRSYFRRVLFKPPWENPVWAGHSTTGVVQIESSSCDDSTLIQQFATCSFEVTYFQSRPSAWEFEETSGLMVQLVYLDI